MSCEFAIRANNLSKHYQIYDRPHDRLKQMMWRGRRRFFRNFVALDGVSFEIRRGETVGIIGRNGSGKSTLLQIICGILSPTAGNVEVNGRIAALLELGAGFNPEFTGRENIYLNASIMGLSREETSQKFEDIVAFADIGDFINQPVKTYSSGMYIRLAFAVAISVDPDILIVDEALSVGDEAFQRKCFSRIQTIQKQGKTVLFVSHSAGVIIELCSKAILMDGGELLLTGLPKPVVSKYQKLIYAPHDKLAYLREEIRASKDQASLPLFKSGSAEGAVIRPSIAKEQEMCASLDTNMFPKSTIWYEQSGACIEDPILTTLDDIAVNILVRRKEYIYTYRVYFYEKAFDVRFGMLIKTVTGLELGGGLTDLHAEGMDCVEAGTVLDVRFSFHCLLLPGTYFLNAGVLGKIDGTGVYLHRGVDVAMFRVQDDGFLSATAIVDFHIKPSIHAAITEETNRT